MGKFIAGLFIGSMAGIFIMALANAGDQENEPIDMDKARELVSTWVGDNGEMNFEYSDGSREEVGLIYPSYKKYDKDGNEI